MPLTTIYDGGTRIIGDSTFYPQNIHPDAMAYINIMRVNGSYAMSSIEVDAVNNLVQSLVANGIWTKMKAVYPIIGGTAGTHKFNLKDPRDVDAAFRLNFIGGWTHNSNGMTGNGTTGYADTFLTPSTTLTLNSTHLSYYTSTTTVSNLQRDIGVYTSGGSAGQPSLGIGTNTNVGLSDMYTAFAGRISTAMIDGSGMLCGTRTSQTSLKLFRNAGQIGSTNTTSTSGQSLAAQKLFIGAYNQSPSSPAALGFSNKNYRFLSIGDGLTDAEVYQLYRAVQIYQTKLGRQV